MYFSAFLLQGHSGVFLNKRNFFQPFLKAAAVASNSCWCSGFGSKPTCKGNTQHCILLQKTILFQPLIAKLHYQGWKSQLSIQEDFARHPPSFFTVVGNSTENSDTHDGNIFQLYRQYGPCHHGLSSGICGQIL